MTKLDALGSAKNFNHLDLASGYWKVLVDENNRHKTAFICHRRLFEFNVMPIGLTNAPETFQRLMDLVLSGIQGVACLVSLDDVLVFSKSSDSHLVRLTNVLQCLQKAGLKLRREKFGGIFRPRGVKGWVYTGRAEPNNYKELSSSSRCDSCSTLPKLGRVLRQVYFRILSDGCSIVSIA